MQHFGAVIRKFRGFARIKERHNARLWNQSRISREKSGNVFPQRHFFCAKRARGYGRGEVGAAAAKRDNWTR